MFVSLCKNICSKLTKSSKNYKAFIFGSARFNSNGIATDANELPIALTRSCIDRLRKIAPDGSFLRITIDGGGCSGFQYRFDLDSVSQPDDICLHRDGVQVVVDKMSLDFLQGSTIDYKEELIRSSFVVVDNPQADAKCSCGSSFSVKTP